MEQFATNDNNLPSTFSKESAAGNGGNAKTASR
jgi:hypothetical protein